MTQKLKEIKENLDSRRGDKILLRANGGRKKMIEKSGVLAETYPSVFIVKLNENGKSNERVSYSYADVLTETVKLYFDEEIDEQLA